MNLHKLAQERSLAYHRVIATRLLQNEWILRNARERVDQWSIEMPERPYVRMWKEILSRDAESVAGFLVERNELAEELRQSSPFSGVLEPRERWRIWRETRDSFETQHDPHRT
jgi:hypothetical protein